MPQITASWRVPWPSGARGYRGASWEVARSNNVVRALRGVDGEGGLRTGLTQVT